MTKSVITKDPVATNNGQIGSILNVITSASDAKAYHKLWVNQLKFGYHPRIQEEFGSDLSEIFGPKANRRSVNQLTEDEINSKLKSIQNFSNPDFFVRKGRLVLENFGVINLVDLQIHKLKAFKQIIDPQTGMPVLYGLELDNYDQVEAFASGVPCAIDCIYVNVGDVQRPVDLVRQAKYMFGNFDSGSFTGAIGQIDSDLDGIVINDGQQGTTLTTDHRLLTIGVNFGVREGVVESARQLLITNIYKNPMKAFEVYRNQVIVAKGDAEAKRPIKQEDRAAYYLDKIVSEPKSRLKFRFEDSECKGGESNTVAQFLKLFQMYCGNDHNRRKPFQEAIRTTLIAFPGKKVTSESVWGLTELYTQLIAQQGAKTITDDLVHGIALVLGKQFKNSNDVWTKAKNSRDAFYPKTDDINEKYYGEKARGCIIASAIVESCKNMLSYERSMQSRGIKELELPTISLDGKSIFIPMPITKADGKSYTRPEATTKDASVSKDVIAEDIKEFLGA